MWEFGKKKDRRVAEGREAASTEIIPLVDAKTLEKALFVNVFILRTIFREYFKPRCWAVN
mgnify:CR=1 FL=1